MNRGVFSLAYCALERITALVAQFAFNLMLTQAVLVRFDGLVLRIKLTVSHITLFVLTVRASQGRGQIAGFNVGALRAITCGVEWRYSVVALINSCHVSLRKRIVLDDIHSVL